LASAASNPSATVRSGAKRRTVQGRSAALGEQAIRSLEQTSNGLGGRGERGDEERDAEG